MSTRETYQPGVPCFVDTLTPDVDAAKRFYGGIFGWEFAGPGAMPGDPPGEYYVARVHGADVVGIGSLPAGNGSTPPPSWNTHVRVASVDETVQRAIDAGGSVAVAPFDASPAGGIAVVRDPSGAPLCVWEPGERQGAARVNEPSAWAMSALNTDDTDGAAAFYGALFGWQTDPFEAGPGTKLWLWRLPGYVGGEPQQPVPRDVVAAMSELPRAPDGPPPHWSVDFWIADAGAAAAAAADLGGAVIAPPFEAGGFRRTVLADPGGAVFSASQLMLTA